MSKDARFGKVRGKTKETGCGGGVGGAGGAGGTGWWENGRTGASGNTFERGSPAAIGVSRMAKPLLMHLYVSHYDSVRVG